MDRYGDYLYAYAMMRLRDHTEAQDMVQETLMAALKNRQRFRGDSDERGWLTGILKHKILDLYRRSNRETSFTDLGFYEDEEADRFGQSGLHQGAWIHHLGPAHWSTRPEHTLDQKEFWSTFYRCVSRLPANTARVFLMREADGVGSAEICSTLRISENNLWVMLHRARMALRRCLETHWVRDDRHTDARPLGNRPSELQP